MDFKGKLNKSFFPFIFCQIFGIYLMIFQSYAARLQCAIHFLKKVAKNEEKPIIQLAINPNSSTRHFQNPKPRFRVWPDPLLDTISYSIDIGCVAQLDEFLRKILQGFAAVFLLLFSDFSDI